MALWERGEALAAHCSTWLDGAEAKLGTRAVTRRHRPCRRARRPAQLRADRAQPRRRSTSSSYGAVPVTIVVMALAPLARLTRLICTLSPRRIFSHVRPAAVSCPGPAAVGLGRDPRVRGALGLLDRDVLLVGEM